MSRPDVAHTDSIRSNRSVASSRRLAATPAVIAWSTDSVAQWLSNGPVDSVCTKTLTSASPARGDSGWSVMATTTPAK